MTALREIMRPKKFEALLRLLDDTSPVVRAAVSQELQCFGNSIGPYIHERQLPLDAVQWEALEDIMAEVYREHLGIDWVKWLVFAGSDALRLEAGLGLLARFQNGPRYRPPVKVSLDALAEEYGNTSSSVNCASLAQFLFKDKGFHCANEETATSDASNLAYVIEHRVGLPIILVCVYILIGHRHGLQIKGCNWPGSFMARYRENDTVYVMDCANGGVVLEADELLRLQGPSREAAEAVLVLDIDAPVLIRRVLGNLAFAYRRCSDTESSLFMIALLRLLEQYDKQKETDRTSC